MVLGRLSTESTQYGKEECTVLPIDGADLSQQLKEAISHIHGEYVAQNGKIRNWRTMPLYCLQIRR